MDKPEIEINTIFLTPFTKILISKFMRMIAKIVDFFAPQGEKVILHSLKSLENALKRQSYCLSSTN